MDGHSGITNSKVNEGGSGYFSLVLSVLKDNQGRMSFIVHASSSLSYFRKMQSVEFLQQIGFSYFAGECQFFRDRCSWREIAYLEKDYDGFEHFDHTQSVHDCFKNFASKIGELYTLVSKADDILRGMKTGLSFGQPLGQAVVIKIEPGNIPLWVNDIKFKRLKQAEEETKKLEIEIKDLREYLPLVYADGDILRDAVIKALKFLGLEANPTQKGFTVDILAQTADGSKKFGFEVTGIDGIIDKKSNKLTQVLDFERIKEQGEKTILLANTYKSLPIKDRKDKVHFTEQVTNFLSKHPILMMTGYDLYRMIFDAMENNKDKSSLVDILYNSEGVLKY